MGLYIAAFSAALLAWCIGKALGVPVWRDWDIGDRADLAVLAFWAVFSGLSYLKKGGS